jgi:hypothetical protein
MLIWACVCVRENQIRVVGLHRYLKAIIICLAAITHSCTARYDPPSNLTSTVASVPAYAVTIKPTTRLAASRWLAPEFHIPKPPTFNKHLNTTKKKNKTASY